jgi:hypothetical protein
MGKPALAGLAVAAAALAVVVVGPALPASAAPAPAACASTGAPYPVGVRQAQIQVSTTVPTRGVKFEVSGTHYLPNEKVKLYIGGSVTACEPTSLAGAIYVGSAETNGSGAFDPGVYVPDSLSGNQIVTGIGASLKKYDFDTQAITIGGATPTSASTSPGSTPAQTGEDIAMMLAAGAVLVGAGVVFTRGGRRRRAASHR